MDNTFQAVLNPYELVVQCTGMNYFMSILNKVSIKLNVERGGGHTFTELTEQNGRLMLLPRGKTITRALHNTNSPKYNRSCIVHFS